MILKNLTKTRREDKEIILKMLKLFFMNFILIKYMQILRNKDIIYCDYEYDEKSDKHLLNYLINKLMNNHIPQICLI